MLATIVFGAIVSLAIEVLETFSSNPGFWRHGHHHEHPRTAIAAALYDREQMQSLLAIIDSGKYFGP